MRLDYNKRVIDALAKALGKTSEQVERILIDSGVMRPNIPLEPFENAGTSATTGNGCCTSAARTDGSR